LDPLEETMPEVTLTAREHALLALLAHGHTDFTASRELGISARSVTNILRRLMDRLHVDNRFQLGLALGTLRAISPPAPVPPSTDRTELTPEGVT
jgi:DNA-binding CsgD family transcriptional regulator